MNALVVATMLRRYAVVDELFPAARAFFEERLLLSPLDDVTQSYARSLIDRGRLDEAEAALATAPRANVVEGMLTDILDALVAARRGRAGAGPLLDRALAAVDGAPDGFREGLVRLTRAEVAWLEGDEASVRSQVVTAKGSQIPVEYRLHQRGAQVAARFGDLLRLDVAPRLP